MPTKLTVFNDALRMLGQPMLASDLQEGEDGRYLRAAWQTAVELAHEKTAWDFARTRWQCARLATTPVHTYDYYYAIPADCLRLLTVSDSGEPGTALLTYAVDQGKIATSATTVYITYVSDSSEAAVGRWSQSFAHYVATELALSCAPKLNSSAVDTISKERKKALSDAIGLDAAQGPPVKRQHGAWSRAARGFGCNVGREQG